MPGQLCEIISREKELEVMAGQLSHFVFGSATPVDSKIVATDRNWTIYCLDPETRQALFLEMPEGTDLGASPFSYMTQFDLAQRAMLVPFDELTHLGDLAPFPPNLVMVYSIGRCGSTLVSKIFAGVENVWSISEPDPVTNLAMNRDKYEADEIGYLIRASIRLSYRPLPGQEIDTFVVKHRSQLLFFLDPMFEALPEAKNIFLYRDADGWTRSVNQFSQRLRMDAATRTDEDLRRIWNILSCNASETELTRILNVDDFPAGFEDVLAACWIINMERILAATNGNADTAFSYTQLNLEREPSVARLLAACDLGAGHLANAMTAYAEDSQKGTSATRDVPIVPLSDAQRARIGELIGKHPAAMFGAS